jgi:hypothetical protein
MGFFGRDDPEPVEEDPLERMTPAGLPVVAEGRLEELASGGLLTNTLSVNEFALLSELGPKPVAPPLEPPTQVLDLNDR